MTALRSSRGWDQQRRASALSGRRERLLARLPHKITAAAALTADVRELIVDDAIEFTALRYEPAVGSQRELERVFWDAAVKRVERAREGRYDTVRAGYERADLAALDGLAVDATPEDEVLARAEWSAALHFTALLDPREREVFRCQQRGRKRPLGAKRVARELGLPLGAVLKAERSIAVKHERFATIYAAGRLCGYLAPAIAALAAEDHAAPGGQAASVGGRELAARVHLQIERCPTCTADYTRQLRYLRGARFSGKVASLLPAPSERLRGGGPRELLPDWAARLLSHEPASSASQLATGGAGRGLATAAAVKLATLCVAGASTVGACVAIGVLPLRAAHDSTPATAAPTPTPASAAIAREPPPPHGAVRATPTATPPTKRTRATSSRRANAATQGKTGAHSHEQTPASPAPANAAAGGRSEFDPTYQPSAPAPPAPVPAAPGGSEFP